MDIIKNHIEGYTDVSPTTARAVVYLLGWVLAIVQTIFFIYVLFVNTTFMSAEWQLYLNVKVPQMWCNTTWLLFVIWLIDALSPGQTVYAIMAISSISSEYEKRTAAIFLIGIAACIAYCIKGGV